MGANIRNHDEALFAARVHPTVELGREASLAVVAPIATAAERDGAGRQAVTKVDGAGDGEFYVDGVSATLVRALARARGVDAAALRPLGTILGHAERHGLGLTLCHERGRGGYVAIGDELDAVEMWAAQSRAAAMFEAIGLGFEPDRCNAYRAAAVKVAGTSAGDHTPV